MRIGGMLLLVGEPTACLLLLVAAGGRVLPEDSGAVGEEDEEVAGRGGMREDEANLRGRHGRIEES